MNERDPEFNPFRLLLDRMSEHREASGARHQALLDGLNRTNEKLDLVVTELSGSSVRFERVDARLDAIDERTKTLEAASAAVKTNILEIVKAVVVPALLSMCSAAAGVFGAMKVLSPPAPAQTEQVTEHKP